MKNPKNVYGYITIEGNNYAFAIENYIGRIFICNKGLSFSKSLIIPEIVYGLTEDNHNIAVYISKTIRKTNCIIFNSPFYIINHCNVEYHDLSKFYKINFVGGCINQIIDPEDVYEPKFDFSDPYKNSSSIKFRPINDVTQSFNLNILNKNVSLSYSIIPYEKRNKNILGETNSKLSLLFKENQELITFKDWYVLVLKIVSLLVLQQNINFDNIKLIYKHNNEDYDASVYVNNHYTDICIKSPQRCIPISLFKNNMDNFIKLIEDENFSINFIPKSNIENKIVNYEMIKNICTALEYEYSILKPKLETAITIKTLQRDVKNYLKRFKIKHNELEEYDYTSIYTSINNWILPAPKQAFEVYRKNEAIINKIIAKKELDISFDKIHSLVQCRNKITHGSQPQLTSEISDIFYAMKIVVYVSILNRIGISDKEIEETLVFVF